VVTTEIITGIESEEKTPLPLDVLAQLWNEWGMNGLFSGATERIGYWKLSYGIFSLVYFSLNQYAIFLLE